MKKNMNKMSAGFVPGLVLPLVIFFLIILSRSGDESFNSYFVKAFEVGIIPKLLSLCLLPNLLLFFVFIRTEKLMAARGVIASMFLFGLVIIILKLI